MGALFLSLLKLAESLSLADLANCALSLTIFWPWATHDSFSLYTQLLLPKMGPSISVSCLLSTFELFFNNSPWKTFMSTLELVNVTLHGNRHLEDMIELRIIREDYPDSSRRAKCNHFSLVSPDRTMVMLRLNVHRAILLLMSLI